MTTKTFDEYIDATKSEDSDDYKYRVTYKKNETQTLVVITRNIYIDADRAGFSGYLTQTDYLPVDILLQIAEDIQRGTSLLEEVDK